MAERREWDGQERRMEPISSSISAIERNFAQHTAEEMHRYKEIIDGISALREASAQSHAEGQKQIYGLTKLINDNMSEMKDFHGAIKRAFPKDGDGNPDYDGHRTAHLAWIDDDKEATNLKNYIRRTVFAGVLMAALAFLGIAAWHELLAGPERHAQSQVAK